MAARNWQPPPKTLEVGTILLGGIIKLDSGAAVLTTTKVVGAAVAKSATGTYTVTLADKYPRLIACVACFGGSVADKQVEVDSSAVSTTGVITLKTVTGGSAADVGAATDIHLMILLQNSVVT